VIIPTKLPPLDLELDLSDVSMTHLLEIVLETIKDNVVNLGKALLAELGAAIKAIMVNMAVGTFAPALIASLICRGAKTREHSRARSKYN
jgi:hypothetical protein